MCFSLGKPAVNKVLGHWNAGRDFVGTVCPQRWLCDRLVQQPTCGLCRPLALLHVIRAASWDCVDQDLSVCVNTGHTIHCSISAAALAILTFQYRFFLLLRKKWTFYLLYGFSLMFAVANCVPFFNFVRWCNLPRILISRWAGWLHFLFCAWVWW